MNKRQRLLQAALLALALAAAACGVAGTDGTDQDICQLAAGRLAECLDRTAPADLSPGLCDPEQAEELLLQDCSATRTAFSYGDSAWDDALCWLGFDSYCGTRGTPTPFPDGAVDLTSYRSDSLMRDDFRSFFGASRFQEYAGAISIAASQNVAFAPVPTEDLVAVRGYTSDVPKDSNLIPDYKQINTALRTQTVTELSRLRTYIKCSSSGLNQLPRYGGAVYRRTNLPAEVRNTYRVGATITERAFTSSSLVLLEEFQGNTTFVMVSRHGREITELSVFPKEREVLFVPGTRFKVLAHTPEADGTSVRITLDEVE